ncbi:hypothetical protein TI39_contig4202g00063 [Zymoseptoria brevis]|uniref:Uncharacterized protein n=1 Tax=Zymoseptoria brevis TaxID=1047168 RepID=A0A0F4GA85_9PEZI|nr:hypothetical protein TI39_contig4202g00063 [Zymoseptoria brevis]
MDAPKFRPTRLAHGTLRIRVDAIPNHDMLLDKAVIAASCPTLEPVLRASGSSDPRHCWGKPDLIQVSGTDDPVEIWSLAINLVDGAYILDGDALRPDPDDKASAFSDSELSVPGWKEIDHRWRSHDHCNQTWRETAVYQHHIMFRMLHNFPVSIEDIPYAVWKDWEEISTHLFRWVRVAGWLCELCARAEYYGCLPKIVNQVVDLMASEPSLWRAVALDPWRFLLLGNKLRWSDLFSDALRHLVVSPHEFRVNQHDIAEMLGMSQEQLVMFRFTAIKRQEEAVEILSTRLRRIQLSTHSKRVGHDEYAAIRTTMINHVELSPSAEWREKQQMYKRAGLIARSIYSEWLAQQEVGERAVRQSFVWRYNTVSRPSGPLSLAVANIQHHANSSEPALLFGVDAAKKYIEVIGGDSSQAAVQAVHVALSQIMLHANDIVESVSNHHSMVEEGSRILTYSRTRWDRGFPLGVKPSVFTYIGWDEWETPWKDKEKWDCKLSVAPLSGMPAPAPLLEALGMN